LRPCRAATAELYNLHDDPQEKQNLIETTPEEADRLARLFGRYYRVRRQRKKGIQGKWELASLGLEEPVLVGEKFTTRSLPRR
jgi:hypothetical protein